jgi:NAD-dependent DNA ligase
MTELVIGGLLVGLVVGYGLGSSGGEETADSVQALLEERREELLSDYEAGRISHAQFASEIELVEDPATETVMYAVTDVDGVGPHTAFEVARAFRNRRELESANVEDLEAINNVGENRARAIHRRVAAE